MRYQVKKGVLLHNGARYARGSFFDADESEVKGLLADGIISRVFASETLVPATPIAPKDPEDPPSPSNDDEFLPTVEEFGKLNAAEQKALLTELQIEPATNAEERLRQYTEFYDKAGIDGDDV